MGNKFQKKVGNWKYLTYPRNSSILRGQLRIAGYNKWSPEIEFIVDTGYTGSILLDFEVYQLLNYDQFSLSKKYWNDAETISGELLIMPKTQTKIRINEYETSIFVESHELIQENLIGMEFLNNFLTLFDGNLEEISLWEFD